MAVNNGGEPRCYNVVILEILKYCNLTAIIYKITALILVNSRCFQIDVIFLF